MANLWILNGYVSGVAWMVLCRTGQYDKKRVYKKKCEMFHVCVIFTPINLISDISNCIIFVCQRDRRKLKRMWICEYVPSLYIMCGWVLREARGKVHVAYSFPSLSWLLATRPYSLLCGYLHELWMKSLFACLGYNMASAKLAQTTSRFASSNLFNSTVCFGFLFRCVEQKWIP